MGRIGSNENQKNDPRADSRIAAFDALRLLSPKRNKAGSSAISTASFSGTSSRTASMTRSRASGTARMNQSGWCWSWTSCPRPTERCALPRIRRWFPFSMSRTGRSSAPMWMCLYASAKNTAISPRWSSWTSRRYSRRSPLNIIWIWTSLTTAVDVAGESRGRSFGPCFPAGLSRGTVPVKNPKVVFSLT